MEDKAHRLTDKKLEEVERKQLYADFYVGGKL